LTFITPRGTPLSTLVELRTQLRGEQERLYVRRAGAGEEKALIEDMESNERQLGLVEITLVQWASRGRGRPDLERGGPGASTQVRALVKLQDITSSS
jgi:hypothetical protein